MMHIVLVTIQRTGVLRQSQDFLHLYRGSLFKYDDGNQSYRRKSPIFASELTNFYTLGSDPSEFESSW